MPNGPSFWGNIADAFIPGDAYGQNGWDRGATISGLAQLGGSLFAGPAGGQIAGMIANKTQGRPMLQGTNLNMFGGLFQGRNPAVNQMANPTGNGYDLKPWGGIGLPGLGQNPMQATYTPPQGQMPGNFGGGARGAFTFGGYQDADHRNASIAATQQALQESRNRTPNNRQMNNYLS
jgi:hypothetical protein